MREITLRAMRFHALVGILPHERTQAQPIEIDLYVRVSDEADAANTAHIMDYRALYDTVSEIVTAGHIDYLEEIGDRIAERVLAEHRHAARVRVAVRKPHVALGGPLAYAEVTTERRADA
jgi:dihydroneopterin aldolase